MRIVNARELPFSVGIPSLLWQALFLYIPCIVLLWYACSTVTGQLTLEWMRQVSSEVYLWVYVRSLFLALTTSVLCLCMAYPISYYATHIAPQWRVLLFCLILLPFWSNFLLHVFAWMFVLEREGVLNTLLQWAGFIQEPIAFLNTQGAVLLMMVYYYVPFMVVPIYTALEKFDRRLFEASYDLGATWWQTMRSVVIPLTAPAVITGCFLVFIPAFSEFAIPELMGGDRVFYAGSLITYLILGGESLRLGAACAVMAGIVLVVAAVCMRRVLGWLLRYS